MITPVRFLFVALVLVLVASAAETEWKAGQAAIRITPSQPLLLAGYAARVTPSTKVEDDLFAKALALEDAQGNRAVLITTDLLGFAAPIADPICARIGAQTGLKREQIILSASHTHTGPTLSLDEQRPGSSPADARNTAAYTHQLQTQLVELAVRALADLAPAKLSWGTGVAHFAVNRREFTARGVRLGVNPRGLVDRSVPVLRIDDAHGKPRTILFGYACHNTTLGQGDYMVSGDYAGAAQAFVQQHYPGVQAMFMMGCGADANPYPRGTLEIARGHGKALGEEVRRVVETPLRPIRGPLTCVLESAALPVRSTPRAELERQLATGNVREKATATKLLAALDRGEPPLRAYPAPVSVWQFGSDLTFVALSGEVVADYVPLIEKAVGPLQLWVSAYAHDVFGYVPSARMLDEGGYEIRGLFAADGIFTAEAETVLVAKVRELSRKAGRPLPASP